MKYTTFGKLYYLNIDEYNEKLKNCKLSPMTSRFDFEINSEQAFYLSVPELVVLQGNIFQEYIQFSDRFQGLPHVAQNSYYRKCLIDEIVITNDLEGVHSSRRDVRTIISTENSHRKNPRFDGLVKKYLRLVEGDVIPLETLQDVRSLYDEIVLPEIASSDIPDGEYFRKGGVEVRSATDRIKHVGILGEDKINKAMNRALTVLNENDVPGLFKIAIFHYLIGYIHPFYDGNGRLSRFISSYLLSRIFSPIVAYRLSYTIKQNHKKYYDAFDYVNDRHNAGDLTPFIICFLELIYDSILSLHEKVNEAIDQLNYYGTYLDHIKDKTICDLIFYFVQNALFSPDPFTLKELSNIMNRSIPTVRKILTTMQDAGIPFIITRHGHANEYQIDLDNLPAALKNIEL